MFARSNATEPRWPRHSPLLAILQRKQTATNALSTKISASSLLSAQDKHGRSKYHARRCGLFRTAGQGASDGGRKELEPNHGEQAPRKKELAASWRTKRRRDGRRRGSDGGEGTVVKVSSKQEKVFCPAKTKKQSRRVRCPTVRFC